MTTNDLEQRLLTLWRTVLNKPELPETASFFRNGGDSLQATRLITLLRAELGRPTLSVRTIFQAPSVTEYVALLEAM
jgi:mycobactin phenyloxazoline synthetase